MFYEFLNDMTFMIAFIFFVLRLQIYLIEHKYNHNIIIFMSLSSIASGILSYLIMINSYVYKGLALDLSSIPIFLTSYLGGWKYGILAGIFPILYRIHISDSFIIGRIILCTILPIIIGSFFGRKTKVKDLPLTLKMANIRQILKGILLFSFIKVAAQYFLLDLDLIIWFQNNILFMGFSVISLLSVVYIINDTGRLVSLQKKRKYHADYDSVTKLLTIRAFKRRVEEIINKTLPVSVIMLDLDFFKKYNDTHGHPAGDKVLESVGQILKENTRNGDLIGRYGGEEFVLCLPHTGKEKAIEIAERLREKISEYPFEGEEKQPNNRLTISLGVTTCKKEKKPLPEMIEEADNALYSSKKRGRNLVSSFG